MSPTVANRKLQSLFPFEKNGENTEAVPVHLIFFIHLIFHLYYLTMTRILFFPDKKNEIHDSNGCILRPHSLVSDSAF